MTDLETVQRLHPSTLQMIADEKRRESEEPQKALDRATQALKDAAVSFATVQHLHASAKVTAMNALFVAAEDYAEVYLKGGGK